MILAKQMLQKVKETTTEDAANHLKLNILLLTPLYDS